MCAGHPTRACPSKCWTCAHARWRQRRSSCGRVCNRVCQFYAALCTQFTRGQGYGASLGAGKHGDVSVAFRRHTQYCRHGSGRAFHWPLGPRPGPLFLRGDPDSTGAMQGCPQAGGAMAPPLTGVASNFAVSSDVDAKNTMPNGRASLCATCWWGGHPPASWCKPATAPPVPACAVAASVKAHRRPR